MLSNNRRGQVNLFELKPRSVLVGGENDTRMRWPLERPWTLLKAGAPWVRPSVLSLVISLDRGGFNATEMSSEGGEPSRRCGSRDAVKPKLPLSRDGDLLA